jgi:hypothetical protein
MEGVQILLLCNNVAKRGSYNKLYRLKCSLKRDSKHVSIVQSYHSKFLVQLLQELANAFLDGINSLADVRVARRWIRILMSHDRRFVLTGTIQRLMHIVRDTMGIALWRLSCCAAVLELRVAARGRRNHWLVLLRGQARRRQC